MNMMYLHNWPDSYIVVFFLIAGALSIVGNYYISYLFSLPLLKKAMEAEEFELVEKKHKIFDGGPFSGKRSINQVLFKIKVKNNDGMIDTGWACIGSGLFGTYGRSFCRKVRLYLPAIYQDVKFKTVDIEELD
jgi:hypothetical protein